MRVAEDAGLFNKYGLDFYLVYISSAGVVTAAMFSGSGDVTIGGVKPLCARRML